MKLRRLRARSYRSLRELDIELSELNLFIGANASGKSTILDALRFLHGGVQAGDFRIWVAGRGGIANLTWKGEETDRIELTVFLEDGDRNFEWSVRVIKEGYAFHVEEHVGLTRGGSSEEPLLEAKQGKGSVVVERIP